jgi:demethylmenaquinone methyltransferase/2-methoxy-6-polyprenyl-1,4-benzoquinol methylase
MALGYETEPMDIGDDVLAEQIAYYRAAADEYAVDEDAGRELAAALDRFSPTGDVLELACGPGVWTEQLLRTADSVTAVDASPEMLARARARVGAERVRFVQADLFAWEPQDRYDLVFVGFWLSHVPPDRFERFWAMVRDCLEPGGRVFFVDDNARPSEELVHGEGSSVVERRLEDGSAHRVVKVPHRPADLQARLRDLGWDITVTAATGPFYWGAGTVGRESQGRYLLTGSYHPVDPGHARPRSGSGHTAHGSHGSPAIPSRGGVAREWTAQEVRQRIESYLLTEGRRLDVELIGTLVPDDDHLTVVVRSFMRGTVGQLQSVRFDLQYIHQRAPAESLDDVFQEVLHGAVNFLDVHDVGVDEWGTRHWTESNWNGRTPGTT